MVRITENNDWVAITLIGCLFLYAFMFMFLLREISLKDFLSQKIEDANNIFLSWMLTSIAFCISLSVLISQYIPIVPNWVSDIQIWGLELNKVGFTTICILAFYLLKSFFSYLFYAGIGNARKWTSFYFVATKFYFVLSIVLIILSFSHYYFDIEKPKALNYYLIFFVFVFIFKNLFYLLRKNQILPIKWYYKILYICTLQIAPLFAIWRLLFF